MLEVGATGPSGSARLAPAGPEPIAQKAGADRGGIDRFFYKVRFQNIFREERIRGEQRSPAERRSTADFLGISIKRVDRRRFLSPTLTIRFNLKNFQVVGHFRPEELGDGLNGDLTVPIDRVLKISDEGFFHSIGWSRPAFVDRNIGGGRRVNPRKGRGRCRCRRVRRL